MASTSDEIGESSNSQNRFEYQVFLSFRGADVRKGWIDHLFRRLKEEGVRVFLDNNDLQHGKKIDLLFEAIERSQIFLVTFSPGYCDSRWCLDELVKIMDSMAYSVSQQHHVLPVFYNVDPTELRHQTGPYEQAFKAHEKDDTGRVTKYRKALGEVTKLRGISLKDTNGYEGQLVNDVIKEVKNRVRTRQLFVPQNIVGRNAIIQNINMWLQDGSNDAQVGIIYGPGGIGKSTVAQIVYNHNLCNFSGSCFLADFLKEATKGRGLTYLLEQIISDVSKKPPEKIYNVLGGLTQVEAVVSCRKILLVLDDVDELTQLGAIFEKPGFFHPGSKIIITTRNQELRKVCKFKREFSISELDNDESAKLFSLHAFQSDQPPQEFMTLSRKFIDYCQGLPLALRILGSSLCGDAKDIWESMLKKLAKEPDHEVQSILKVSFDSIKDNVTKKLFLDIAHYFIGMGKDDAYRILEGMGLHPRFGFPQLVNRCLVTVSICGGKLVMHQLLQEMAREVVREEARDQPGHRSSLLDFEDSYKVLKNNEGTGNVRCLRVDFRASVGVHLTLSSRTTTLGDPPVEHVDIITNAFTKMKNLQFVKFFCKHLRWLLWKRCPLESIPYLTPSPRTTSLCDPPVEYVVIKTNTFTKMKNLELLQFYCVQLTGGYSDFPKHLRWLLWDRCPLESIPSDLELDELVVLDIENSSLVHVWENTKELQALKVINLSHSIDLVDTPNFSGCPALERIVLEGCSKLVEIHGSITQLRRLTHINLSGCANLVSIPNFSGCSALEHIDLISCSKLVEIHGSITQLRRLTHIDLSHCTNLMSTPNFSGCSALECIKLDGCSKLVEIHGSITQLRRLHTIHLKGCTNLVSTPNFSGCSTLEYIFLQGCSKLVEIHGSISQLRRLTYININGCTDLVTTPNFSECSALHYISLEGCSKLAKIHESITHLRGLKSIDLRGCTNFVTTPNFSGCLALQTIGLKDCTQLVEIHESITLLSELRYLNVIRCTSLRRIPRSTAKIVEAYECEELVEIGDNTKLESRKSMDAYMTEYIGYAGLESFVTGDGDGLFGCYKGVYQCGLYSVFLAGDHSANWFNSMTQGLKLNYIVPMPYRPDRRIRALNICCVYEGFAIAKRMIEVHNQSTSCKWFYEPILYPVSGLYTYTWLTHWPITQHRELDAGDVLEITFHGSRECVAHTTMYGIHIVYEDGGTEEVEDHVLSCNSLSNNGQGASRESVANWYENTFRRVDLSTYERQSIRLIRG